MSESIKVILKQKSIPTLVEFCVDEKIEFNVHPQAFPDNDWEFNLMVKDIKTAVMTGMFLRENRIDIAGNEQPKSRKPAPKRSKEEDEKLLASNTDEQKSPEPDVKGLF